MKNNPQISYAFLKHREAFAYKHAVNLFEKANNLVFTDIIQLCNSTKITANKNNVDTLKSKHTYQSKICPNGVLQINYTDVKLPPKNAIEFSLLIRTKNPIVPHEKMIKKIICYVKYFCIFTDNE